MDEQAPEVFFLAPKAEPASGKLRSIVNPDQFWLAAVLDQSFLYTYHPKDGTRRINLDARNSRLHAFIISYKRNRLPSTRASLIPRSRQIFLTVLPASCWRRIETIRVSLTFRLFMIVPFKLAYFSNPKWREIGEACIIGDFILPNLCNTNVDCRLLSKEF